MDSDPRDLGARIKPSGAATFFVHYTYTRPLTGRKARFTIGQYRRPKRASTPPIDCGRIARHIKPLIGSKLIADLTPADVEAFFRAVRQGKTAATGKTGPRGLAG